MSEGSALNLVLALGFLTLAVSALLSQRLSWRSLIGGLVRWTCIFTILFVVFAYRDDLNMAWQRLQSEWGPNRTEVVGRSLRIRPQGGHWFVSAEVNGKAVRFMIDTGATISAMGSEEAARIDLQPSSFGFPVVIQTANGSVQARRATMERLKVGPIERADLSVLVGPSFGDLNVLGVNFLNTLSSWRVERGVMILES